MDLDSPIVGVVFALVLGVALLVLTRVARAFPDPIAGAVRLQAGGISFTEIFGVFLVTYGVVALFMGPPSASSGVPTRGPGPGGGVVVGRFGPAATLLRGGPAVTAGFAVAFVWSLYRMDVIGRLTNPQSNKSVAAIVGTVAEAVEDIPAGGHGQITFRDPGGTLVGIIAASDTFVPRGARVRIVGTKGLNPLVVLTDQTATSPASS